MQYIREWIICLTLCSLGCSIIYALTPKGTMEKSMKTVIALFMISALASPLSQLVKNGIQLDIPTPEQTFAYAQQVNSTLLSATEQAVKQSIIEAVPEIANGNSVIEVSAATDSNNTVFIEYICIYLNNPQQNPDEIRNQIYEKLKLTAEVTQ